MERTLKNAISKAKRDLNKGVYGFYDIMYGIESAYYLRTDEVKILKEKMIDHVKKDSYLIFRYSKEI